MRPVTTGLDQMLRSPLMVLAGEHLQFRQPPPWHTHHSIDRLQRPTRD